MKFGIILGCRHYGYGRMSVNTHTVPQSGFVGPVECHDTHIFVNRSISRIPQYIRQISQNAPFCNRNVHICEHWYYKMGHCRILFNALWDLWDGCIEKPGLQVQQLSISIWYRCRFAMTLLFHFLNDFVRKSLTASKGCSQDHISVLSGYFYSKPYSLPCRNTRMQD